MVEPLTLAGVGAAVLTEGVKFLYGQATEILKSWRSRKQSKEQTSDTAAGTKVLLPLTIFEDPGDEALEIHAEAVDRLEPELRELRTSLSDYADGIEPVSADDERLVASFDGVRRILEAIYQRPLLLKGESRPESDVVVKGSVDVESVRGYVAGVRARVLRGHFEGKVKAGTAEAGSVVIGVDQTGR